MSTFDETLERGKTLLLEQDADAAEKAFREALSAGEASFGVDSPALLPALAGIVRARASREKACKTETEPTTGDAELLDAEARALAIARAHLPRTARELVTWLTRHGVTRWTIGDARAARALLEEACDIGDQYFGGTPAVASTVATLVDVLFELGDMDAALPLCERVVALEQANRSGPASLAMATSQLGRCLLLRGEFARAERNLEEALELRHRAYPNATRDKLADLWRELLERARRATD